MNFRICGECGEEKTIRQFSLRRPNICRICFDKVERRYINGYNVTYHKSIPKSIFDKDSKNAISKLIPKSIPKEIVDKESKNEMGFVVVKDIKPPQINVHSYEFDLLSSDEKRAIIKADTRYRRVMEARGKQ